MNPATQTSSAFTPEADEVPGEPDDPPASPPHSNAQPHVKADSHAIEIAVQDDVTQPVDTAWLHAHLASAASNIATTTGHRFESISVAIVTAAFMRDLNRQFHNHDTVTDVLTFNLTENTTGNESPISVDIALCADVAADGSHALDRELLLYAIHGLLHCAGFNDHDESEAKRMHEEEDRILESIGVGATYFSRSEQHRSEPGRPRSRRSTHVSTSAQERRP